MFKKASLYVAGISGALVGLVAPFLSHAQFVVSTTTEATNNGSYLQIAYSELINFLSSTGGVLFMIVLTILGIVVWLAVKAPHHVINS